MADVVAGIREAVAGGAPFDLPGACEYASVGRMSTGDRSTNIRRSAIRQLPSTEDSRAIISHRDNYVMEGVRVPARQQHQTPRFERLKPQAGAGLPQPEFPRSVREPALS